MADPRVQALTKRMNSKELQSYGQEQYRKGNIEAALHAFSDALEGRDVHDRIGLLDNRAAAYSALSKPEMALKDGRSMIKLDKTDPRGHLRTGKTLLKLKKMETALGIYNYGLQHVPESSKGRPNLMLLRDKLQSALSPPQAKDPLCSLPLEIVEMIFDHLSLANIVRILRVSKSWNNLLRAIPRLWKHLDLQPRFKKAKKQIKPQTFRAYLRNANDSIISANLFEDVIGRKHLSAVIAMMGRCHVQELELRCSSMEPEIWIAIQGAKNLKSLSIVTFHEYAPQFLTSTIEQNSPLQKLTSLSYEVFEPTRTAIAANSVSETKFLNLKSFRVTHQLANCNRQIREERFAKNMMVSMPDLEDLKLPADFFVCPDFYSHFSKLRFVDVSGALTKQVLTLPPTVECLKINDTRAGWDHASSLELESKTPHFPNLREFEYKATGRLSPFKLLDLILAPEGGPRSLESVKLEWHTFFDLDEFKDFCRRDYFSQAWSRLRIFKITSATSLDDSLISLLEVAPNLEVFDATGCSITGVTVKALVEGNKKLHTLRLVECIKISADAVEFARNAGINVIMRQESSQRSGKRVRYL